MIRTPSASVLSDPLFDRKFDMITEGIDAFVIKKLRNLSEANINTITTFMLAINTESNPSNSYRQQLVLRLCELGKFVNYEEFKQITREVLIQFMDKFRKPEAVDQLHKWVGTYNFFLVLLVKFFRWLRISYSCSIRMVVWISGYMYIHITILASVNTILSYPKRIYDQYHKDY